ncbi:MULTISPECIES: hypothetical protein [Phaeobacter]|uniref:hypothetical protein n=1 Tax=Phaeobacter TaxID=302485 RepID=UPI00058C410E|nr:MULTISPECIES: hypothetical protein [Phaeobacter]AUQ62356.1 hypothetical protein PhaeoP51_01361 [Phaeobacter inhibens]AUQ91322.1 hypothetical protein PhaeoP24_02732 [Phaeobacter inhibens]UTS79545.1 hypothetical protein OL67_000592 [Phaeobacter piscinae]
MAEIEIRTTGELIVNLEVVGQITWAKPLIESEIAGIYDDHGFGYDEWGDPLNCTPCDEKDDALSELDAAINDKLAKLLKRVRKEALGDGVLISSLDEIDVLIAELEFSA